MIMMRQRFKNSPNFKKKNKRLRDKEQTGIRQNVKETRSWKKAVGSKLKSMIKSDWLNNRSKNLTG
jgi:hypothetical protein